MGFRSLFRLRFEKNRMCRIFVFRLLRRFGHGEWRRGDLLAKEVLADPPAGCSGKVVTRA
jgi:hypothetical protein